MTSTPLEDSVAFLQLRDRYKNSLLEDSRLTKAAGLAAQRELLLNSPAEAAWKIPRLKALNKELRVWSQKIRQPGQAGHPGSPEDDSNLAVGPTQQFMGNIAKLKHKLERPAATPPITPAKQSVKKKTVKSEPIKKVTPKQKVSPKFTPKKVSPPAPKLKTPFSPKEQIYSSEGDFESATDELPSSSATPKTGKQLAHSFIKSARTKAIEAAKNRAKEMALKRLERQPGWKHFGSPPLKRRLEWSEKQKRNPYKRP